MKRKDLIIVAAVINAGLLVTLFVSALKTDSGSGQLKKKEIAAVKPVAVVPKGKDQIDQVLSNYSAKTEAKAKPKVTKVASLPKPALTPKKKVEAKPAVRMVTIEKGDVLEKIARSNGVSVDAIMKLNHLTNSRLQIGQELQLPEKKVVKSAPKKIGNFYVVQEGDNPWVIANAHNMQVEELLRLNDMDEAKAKRLRPGDRLKIK